MATAKCVLAIPVEYDDEMTDDESLATAFDLLLDTASSTPGIWDDYGEVLRGEFYPIPTDPEHVHQLHWRHSADDDVDISASQLVMVAREDAYGVTVDVMNDHNERMCSVIMDYHGNKLQALVFDHTENDPLVAYVLSKDVKTDRQKRLFPEEPENAG